jgi:hypothetical protein
MKWVLAWNLCKRHESRHHHQVGGPTHDSSIDKLDRLAQRRRQALYRSRLRRNGK